MIRPYDSLIVQKVTQFSLPLIQVFAVYVLLHGHYSPGGGFQAGVLLGAAIILKALVDGQKEMSFYSLSREFIAAVAGLGIYAGIGLLAMLFGGAFLDYAQIPFFASSEAMRRYYGILGIEIGVTIAVAMTLVIIFHVLALTERKEDSSV